MATLAAAQIVKSRLTAKYRGVEGFRTAYISLDERQQSYFVEVVLSKPLNPPIPGVVDGVDVDVVLSVLDGRSK